MLILDVFDMYLNISVANKLEKSLKYKIYTSFWVQLTIEVVVEWEGGREKWGHSISIRRILNLCEKVFFPLILVICLI